MGSLPGRRCSNGSRCVAYPQLGEPVTLTTDNKDDVCFACQKASRDADIPPDQAQQALDQEQQAEEASRLFGPDVADDIQELKEELISQLLIENGPFWEAVRAVRKRWGIEPTVQLPPLGQYVPYPGEVAERSQGKEQPSGFTNLRTEWLEVLSSVTQRMVPERLWIAGVVWLRFFAVCILYHPPNPTQARLVDFSQRSNLAGYDAPVDVLGEEVHINEDPIMLASRIVRRFRDPHKTEAALKELLWRILDEIGTRHMMTPGLDWRATVKDVMTNPSWFWEKYNKKLEENPPRYYIEVDEHTTIKDVRKAFSTIRANEKGQQNFRTPNRLLIAVEASILHDKHGWSYERLADYYGWSKSSNVASKFIKAGRDFRAVIG